MSRTPDLIVPGKHDRERRFYCLHSDAVDTSGATVVLAFNMCSFVTGVAGTVNPGMPVAALATHVHITWAVAAHTVVGDWVLSLHQNEGAAVATFPMVSAAPGVMAKGAGRWSTTVRFAAGDTWHLTAAGPQKNFILARAILRFEEIW